MNPSFQLWSVAFRKSGEYNSWPSNKESRSNLKAGSNHVNLKGHLQKVWNTLNTQVPAPSKGCQIVSVQRVSIHHPLGFNWHPFEGAGRFEL